MAQPKNVTGSTPTSLGTIDSSKQGMTVIIRLSGNLDSGTITFGTRPKGDTGVIEILDATKVLGDSITLTVGSGMEVWVTQSGSSSNVNYIVSQY